jgi:hypothetical protein
MARLFTVEISVGLVPHVTYGGAMQRVVECDFAGIHFSRDNEIHVKRWVRVCAKHRYGPDTQVIFLHTERTEQ